MARIVVYYYVLLVDFFKDTEKNEFYIPFKYAELSLAGVLGVFSTHGIWEFC